MPAVVVGREPRGGDMEEIIERVAAQTGIAADVVRNALGIVVRFLARAAPQERIAALADKLPGLDAMTAEAGAGAGDILGVLNELAESGLGLGEIQKVLGAFLDEARARVGADEIDALIASIPALRQFI